MRCFCGMKKKYSLNVQTMCDSMGSFLEIEIAFPGAASDFFAFNNSQIKKKLELNARLSLFWEQCL